MTSRNTTSRGRLGTAMIALAVGLGTIPASTPALAQSARSYKPTQEVQLSVGEGQMISLPRNVVDVWTSNPTVADVHVTSPRQLNLFGKEFGEATVIATAADGSVVYGANVRVSQNLPSINEVMNIGDARVRHSRRDRRTDRNPERHRCFAGRRGVRRAAGDAGAQSGRQLLAGRRDVQNLRRSTG